MDKMIDIDDFDGWETRLTAVLRGHLPASFHPQLLKANPRSVANAYDFLYDLPGLKAMIDVTLSWLESTSMIAAYHGSRLTDSELVSVQTRGLLPLDAASRRERLVAVLSAHPEWPKAQARLDETLVKCGPKGRDGQREGQVHLLLSRRELTKGDYRRILGNGSEFDQCVTRDILGAEGVQMLARYGEYRVLKYGIPGLLAVEAANSPGGFEDSRTRERIPNPVNQFLSSWCFRQAQPLSEVRAPHCSMMFREPVPASWLQGVETLPDAIPSRE